MITPEDMLHEQASELLPWLVNESLPEDEREAVLAHTRSCVICRRELDALESLQSAITRTGAAERIPAPDMREINARIDTLIERRGRWRRWLTRCGEWLGNPWRTAFAVQAVVLVAVASALFWSPAPAPEFTTLTSPESTDGSTYLRVVVDPVFDDASARKFLSDNRLIVVEGPSSRGIYKLRPEEPSADLDAVAAELLRNPNILFAEPTTQRARQ